MATWIVIIAGEDNYLGYVLLSSLMIGLKLWYKSLRSLTKHLVWPCQFINLFGANDHSGHAPGLIA